MTPLRIRYRFVLPDGAPEVFDLFFDAGDFKLLNPRPAQLPFWTELGCNQCENCPLKASDTPHCPVAVQLVGVIERLERVVSFEQVRVDVYSPERAVSQETTAQQALSSMLGLIMASSGCPRTQFLRPMARFHLPLATEAETIYRTLSMYALARLMRPMQEDAAPEAEPFANLKQLYEELHIVNRGVTRRLGAATRNDPARNAVVLLDAYATLLPHALEQSLDELRPLFRAFPI